MTVNVMDEIEHRILCWSSDQTDSETRIQQESQEESSDVGNEVHAVSSRGRSTSDIRDLLNGCGKEFDREQVRVSRVVFVDQSRRKANAGDICSPPLVVHSYRPFCPKSAINTVASTRHGHLQSLASNFPENSASAGASLEPNKPAGKMGLNNLPYDLLLNIATRLDIQDVHALHLVSVFLHLGGAEWGRHYHWSRGVRSSISELVESDGFVFPRGCVY